MDQLAMLSLPLRHSPITGQSKYPRSTLAMGINQDILGHLQGHAQSFRALALPCKRGASGAGTKQISRKKRGLFPAFGLKIYDHVRRDA